MLEHSDLKRRRRKFYWILTFGFAYFIVKGIWNLLIFLYKKTHKFISLVLNKVSNSTKKA